MTDDNQNLVIGHLQDLRNEVRTRFDNVDGQLNRINLRLSAIEAGEAQTMTVAAADRHALDQLQERVSRIERRFELVDDAGS